MPESTDSKNTFYISFGLGNVHRNSYAKVNASSREVVLHYCNNGMFPGYAEVYTEAKWKSMRWTSDKVLIPCEEILP